MRDEMSLRDIVRPFICIDLVGAALAVGLELV